MAAETPRIVVLVDGSVNTAADVQVRDRLRLVVDHLLPKDRQIWHFDRDIRQIPTLSDVGFESRWSDYHLALAQVAALERTASRPTVALVLGGGQLAVQPPEVGSPGPEAANAAAEARTTTDFADLVAGKGLRWLVLAPQVWQQESGLWAWLRQVRPDTRFLSSRHLLLSEVLPALANAGVPIAGQVLGGTVRVLSQGSPAVTCELAEGSATVDLYVNALGEDPDYAIAVTANGKALPAAQIQEPDGLGVARHLVLVGLEAGAGLSIGMSGFSQGYEVLVVAHPRIQHRMTVQADSDDGHFYAGDRLPIAHLFTRAPGNTPVSAATGRDLIAAARLRLNGQELPSTAQLDLPAEPGSGSLLLSATGPLAAWIVSEPLAISWSVLPPLMLTGGFTKIRSIEDGRVDLRVVQTGGRRHLPELPLTLVHESGATQVLTLTAVPGSPREFVLHNQSFGPDERGRWRIADPQPTVDGPARMVQGSGLSMDIAILRDWLPLLLLGGFGCAILIGSIAWWWMRRPRFAHQVLEQDGTCTELSDLPGVRRGCSWGLPGFVRTVTFTLDPHGAVHLTHLDAPVGLFVNGRAVAVGTAVKLRSGSDIEVVLPAHRRIHARFWTSVQDRDAWSADRAQIDLGRDFAGEHVVLEP